MILCPYCHSKIEKKIEYIPLSHKRKAVLDAIIAAGPRGIKKHDLAYKFFVHNKSDTTIRTTIFHINQKIRPLKIVTKAGIIRLDER